MASPLMGKSDLARVLATIGAFVSLSFLPDGLLVSALASERVAYPLNTKTTQNSLTLDASGQLRYRPENYVPAVVRLSFTVQPATGGRDGFIDIVLIPPSGSTVGRRVNVSTSKLTSLLRQLYAQLSRQDSLESDNPLSPSRQLYRILIDPIKADLKSNQITTLLISADPGLQAIPFAALHDGTAYLGEKYAFSLTPSLGLMPLGLASKQGGWSLMAAGASKFEGLSPLPLVPQEVAKIAEIASADTDKSSANTYLNDQFTPQLLINKAADNSIDKVHVATHAEFLPGGPSKAKLFTGTSAMSLSEFASLRQRREGSPLQLFVLSACRTALGDRDSELGFAGLALQAGSRSAVGTLWYVDDVATAAYFIQFYRYLAQGYPKANALQATRQDLIAGRISLVGDRVLAADGSPLLTNLTPAERQRIRGGLSHPFFWAGITMLGTPW